MAKPQICKNYLNSNNGIKRISRNVNKDRTELDEFRRDVIEQLKLVYYFHKQAQWLQQHFPDAELRDVEGLVKLVDISELKTNDWSLTPGRYVGVAPEEVDENFDFEETLRDIHIELEDLNAEAAQLAVTITKNFRELGV
jgi:type I restriction enzyme M protein